MNIPLVDLKSQYITIKEEIDESIKKVLDNTAFIMGENVSKFEREFAGFCNKKFAIGVSCGTAALFLALKAYGVGKGDEVITVPNTFIATTESIIRAGASVKFVDIEPKTYNIDVTKIEQAITEKTKAIIPVHLYGQSADMGPIKEIAEKHNLKIIEDCCQAHGSEYKKTKLPFTETGCFSFYPGKNLGAYGDAGAVVTDNEKIAEKIAILRDHGRKKGTKYEHDVHGYWERLDALQAAILRVKLKYLGKWTDMRRKNAKIYNEFLSPAIQTPFEADYAKHVYHLYVIRAKEREKLINNLSKNGISTGIHYPIPIHFQKAYSFMNLINGSFPETEKASQEILSLPMFPELTEEQIGYVCEKIKEFESMQNG